MSSDPSLHEEAFPYFANEATDLLQNIEQDLLSLREDRTSARVHSLMRYAHTLKGAAATVGLETVKHVAHVLEDVFRALYNPDIEIDDEVEALLFEGYECLRMPLMAELQGGSVDESDIFNRAAAIISRLQDKLGDLFDRETPIPTAEELGFDVVKSMFEVGVEQRLSSLEADLAADVATTELAEQLQTTCEVFQGLAESLQLPGFGKIADVVLQGLTTQPGNRALIQQAYEDLRAGQRLVLGGDRAEGGSPSEALMTLVSGGDASAVLASDASVDGSGSLPANLDVGELEGLFGSLTEASGSAAQVPELMPPDQTSPDLASGAMDLPNLDGQLESLFGESSAPGLGESDASESDSSESREIPHEITSPPSEGADGPEPSTLQPLSSLDDLFSGLTPEMANSFSGDTAGSAMDDADADSCDAEELLGEAVTSSAPPQPTKASSSASKSNSVPEPSLATTAAEVAISQAAPVAQADAASPSVASASATVPSEPPSRPRLKKAATVISASPAKASRGRESKVTMRVGLDQVFRLDHLVGELLTNQIQSSEQDEQLRQGVLELLDQLRKHRITLSDLQNASQQISSYREERSPAQEDADALARSAIKQPRSSKISKKQQGRKTQSNVAARPIAIPRLPLSEQFREQFDDLEMDRYSELQLITQKALNEAVQLEIVIEAVERQSKQNRQTCDARQRLFRQLRDDLAAVRLKAVGELFQRFPRVLQQLSTTYGKQVELTITGGHVLIDKVTLDSLYDSLLHLVRNAFDHGIGTAEEREAAGKPSKGQIVLSAFQQGNRTVIEVRDDGKGVNLERIAEKAIAQGLINATEVDSLTEPDLLELLFHPGFSTAESVSDLSGRGVGLDVVRSQIESLEGNLSIRSEQGQGTSFILQFPLSVTITKQLICTSAGTTYAIAADSIEQVLLPRGEQLRRLNDGRQVLTLRQGETDSIIPVVSLDSLVDYVHAPTPQSNNDLPAMQPILLVACHDGVRGIQVDQVVGEQELSIRAMDPAVSPPAYIQGCTILGNAQLALAIEPSLLLEQFCGLEDELAGSVSIQRPSRKQASVGRDSAPAGAMSKAPRVLVIDDSLTQRRTLERTLATAGYEVRQAEDGLDAMVSLQKSSDVNLILCDLEMPRMNGFEFLSQSRSIEGLKGVPIVMLTSRSGGKYRQLATELGAAEFLSKPYTDYELLNTLSGLLAKAVPA